ncbi:hypothetical protein D9623_32610 [Azospirillum brasilense]|uniref:Uncharacterized protein n=1 Tax=Azospirillum brasilense TaxID=192 RepID=A0A0P0FDA7_AZOBR|nr:MULTISPECIES: hypothetical protein [Azospirillum]ALJ38941.1 hypothetical protein AMK58_25950 [Azospirillum brasilense]MDW7557375.1 hypothetical protein [Azospirillum brasilense]MDW7597044.1 hypothetical protein [Azospirillum brasilense]MDW7632139.1 hypothetical protein [Azospirillum brasilense]MDX5950662.1 hypothetical protein [Azospirillum brasilense]
MTIPAPAPHEGLCAKLLRSWRGARSLDALQALAPHDRDRVLADAGLTDLTAPAVLRAGHVGALLPAAMALHGVDGAAVEQDRPDLLNDLQRVCALCRGARTCRQLLAEGCTQPEHARLCPNADTLDALR